MSLLKTNEIQNYNGSSLTLTASTVSTSAQLNTGGNISVTGSLNVSDDSTTRTNLGLGTIATQDSDSITVTGGTATLGALTVSGSDSGDLVRITQTGSGNALVVEDSANPDSTPFVVDSSGKVGIGSSPSYPFQVGSSDLIIDSSGNVLVGDTNSGYNSRILLKSPGATSTTSAIYAINSSNTTIFQVRSDGLFNTGTASLSPYNYTTGGSANVVVDSNGHFLRVVSSIKYKTDVEDATHGLAEVLQLRPVTYKSKNDGDKVFGGLIAEEVHEAGLIEFVQYAQDGSPDALHYSSMVSLTFKAIQEQQAIIESQQSQIDALTARIEALENPAE